MYIDDTGLALYPWPMGIGGQFVFSRVKTKSSPIPSYLKGRKLIPVSGGQAAAKSDILNEGCAYAIKELSSLEVYHKRIGDGPVKRSEEYIRDYKAVVVDKCMLEKK